DVLRISMSLSPISLMASSQEMRCQAPFTSFIGYFRRRSPWTISRMAAPLAQWEPRLIGLNHDGSCPTHTPFCTSAVTVQPTEQWVQMFFFRSMGCWKFVGPASARRTAPTWIVPTAASAPAVKPARFRKARLSTRDAPPKPAATACSRPCAAAVDLRLMSMAASPSVPVDPVEVLNVFGLAISRLVVAGRLGHGLGLIGDDRCERRHGGARTGGAEEAASIKDLFLLFVLHCFLPSFLHCQAGSAKASASISIMARPSVPTAR